MKYGGFKYANCTELTAGKFSIQFYESQENLSGTMRADGGFALRDTA